MPAKVLLVIPNRGTIEQRLAMSLMQCAKKQKIFKVLSLTSSVLPHTFNMLWAEGLNLRKEFDYFIMVHDDIVPKDAFWVDVLVAEFERISRNGPAKFLSVVQAIKDEEGYVSTAIMNPETRQLRRLTTTEVMTLPVTFRGEDVVNGHCLLPNSGLFICDFRQKWVEQVCFNDRCKIFRDEADGKWKAQAYTEDWDMGAQLHQHGVEVYCTRVVPCVHVGRFDFPNCVAFGVQATDPHINYWKPPQRDYK
jgi:hypothetical protein